MIRLRPILISAGATFAGWPVLCAVLGVVAVEGALHIPRLSLTEAAEDRAAAIAANDDAVLSDVFILAADNVVLRGWKIQPRRANRIAVILLHGQGDNRAGMLGPAAMLLRHGFSVLLPDARAHGASGGAIGTYGVLEADDVRRWFDWLKKNDEPSCIDGLGDSMGAAELLRSLDEEPGFCAVVAESPFATFREAAYDRIGQQFSTGQWLGRTLLRPAITLGIEYARLRYGIDLRKADPARTVATSHIPVLLIHGLSDANLPPRHSEIIRAGNPTAVVWEPVGADHCGASTTAPLEYERRVVGWFENHDHNKDRP